MNDRDEAIGTASTVHAARTSDGPPDPGELPRGTTLGRYVILKRLGRGGMGIVYLAFDGELDRRVAIKVLRPRADGSESTTGARTRLLREAQAMAKVSHPNVIAVHDVGTFGDEVFVAMEYVPGVTLRAWRAAAPRSAREVLAAYAQAGRGLEAAHAAGILHRDFKPDNVLVDERGRVRVLDFGLARLEVDVAPRDKGRSVDVALDDTASHARALLETPLTQEGDIVGTPVYMAPEQLMGEKVTARSDQFSFCVALYEALYGHLPFEGKTLTARVIAIREGRVRGEPRAKVPRGIRAAVLRGMSSEEDDRFATMAQLLDALDRASRRPAWWLATGIAAALGLAVVGFAVLRPAPVQACRGAGEALATAWSSARSAEVQRAFAASGSKRSDEAFSHLRDALDRYARSWTHAYTDACEATRVRGEQSEQALDLRMACLRQRRKEMGALVDLLTRADAKLADKAVEAAASLTPVDTCTDVEALRAPFAPPRDEAQRLAVESLRERLANANALMATDRSQEALADARALVDEAASVGYRPVHAEALDTRGRAEQQTQKPAEAEPFLFQAAVEAEAVRHDAVAVDAFLKLALVRMDGLHDYETAERYRSLADAAATRANSDALRADVVCSRASAAILTGDSSDAQRLARACIDERERILGAEHPQTILARQILADALWDQGDIEAALPLYEAILRARKALLGPTNTMTLRSVADLGVIRTELGDYDAAIPLLEEALNHPDTTNPRFLAPFRSYYAQALAGAGRVEDALAQFDQARAEFRALYGDNRERVLSELADFGRALAEHRADRAAEAAADEALQATTLRDQERGEALGVRALCKARRGDAEGAVADAEVALALPGKNLGERADLIPLLARGEAELARHRAAAAVDPLERAVALGDRHAGDRAIRAEARFALARALAETGGDARRANELATRAAADLDSAKLPQAANDVRVWMASHKVEQ